MGGGRRLRVRSGMPPEFGNIGDDFAFAVVGADALGFRHCYRPALLGIVLSFIIGFRA